MKSRAASNACWAGLVFATSSFSRPLAQLSGGQRVRVALARLLLLSPDVLLLDEPTNHLDTQGIEWLESFLSEWEGTLIVVSHDRYFIDEVCDHIWEMSRGRDGESHLADYHGSYTDYVEQRDERRERAQKDFGRAARFHRQAGRIHSPPHGQPAHRPGARQVAAAEPAGAARTAERTARAGVALEQRASQRRPRA